MHVDILFLYRIFQLLSFFLREFRSHHPDTMTFYLSDCCAFVFVYGFEQPTVLAEKNTKSVK